jgi:hypothetical protein
MEKNWKNKLKTIELYTDLDEYVPFKFSYAVRETTKAILFKLGDHVAQFVPKSCLLHDRYGIRGKAGWIYISQDFRVEIIKQNIGKDIGI